MTSARGLMMGEIPTGKWTQVRVSRVFWVSRVVRLRATGQSTVDDSQPRQQRSRENDPIIHSLCESEQLLCSVQRVSLPRDCVAAVSENGWTMHELGLRLVPLQNFTKAAEMMMLLIVLMQERDLERQAATEAAG